VNQATGPRGLRLRLTAVEESTRQVIENRKRRRRQWNYSLLLMVFRA